jgi:hypothetical protein
MSFRLLIGACWWRQLTCMMSVMLPNWLRQDFIRWMARGGLGITGREAGLRVSSLIIRVLFMRHKSADWQKPCSVSLSLRIPSRMTP